MDPANGVGALRQCHNDVIGWVPALQPLAKQLPSGEALVLRVAGIDEDFQLFLALLDADRVEGRPRASTPTRSTRQTLCGGPSRRSCSK